MNNMYKLAEDINFKVNASVTYCSDIKQYNMPEFWIEANSFGDCEDYALLKRALLLKANWPKDKLFLTCCWDETNQYHCVLMVDTNTITLYLGQMRKRGNMVRIILLTILLSICLNACTTISTDIPKFGKPVDAPEGYKGYKQSHTDSANKR